MRISRVGPQLLLWVCLLFFHAGCSLFFGSIRPVEERSSDYEISDPTIGNSDWIRVDSQKRKSGPANELNQPDLTFQSKATRSVISVNSVCKHYPGSAEPSSLQELTRQLLLGVSEIALRKEVSFKVDSTPALETTVKGHIEGKSMVFRTVVMEKDRCVYDLMYFAEPQFFEKNTKIFSDFVDSLHIR